MNLRASRAVATLALAAASWMVWLHAPDALAIVGLDDLDIPGRVGAVFLFLSVVEAILERVQPERKQTDQGG